MWPCVVKHTVHYLSVWKESHSQRSGPVVGGAPLFSSAARGAVTCARGGTCKATSHLTAIHQLIDCPLYLILYFYSGSTLMRFMFVV